MGRRYRKQYGKNRLVHQNKRSQEEAIRGTQEFMIGRAPEENQMESDLNLTSSAAVQESSALQTND